MKYKIDQNLKNLSIEEREKALKDFQEILDKEYTPIKFVNGTKIRTFHELVFKFFVGRLITNHSVNGRKQCGSSRRRSAIDFYLLQKHYLETPLDMITCWDIYLKIDRGTDPWMKSIKKHGFGAHRAGEAADKAAKAYFEANYSLYYCTTVRRNVYSLYSSVTMDSIKTCLKEYDYPLKKMEEVKPKEELQHATA